MSLLENNSYPLIIKVLVTKVLVLIKSAPVILAEPPEVIILPTCKLPVYVGKNAITLA